VIVRLFPVVPGQVTAADLVLNDDPEARPSDGGVHGEALPEVPQ
jgi:hypothetical protein